MEFPPSSNPIAWWEEFWKNRSTQFGPPSDEVLNLIPHPKTAISNNAIDIGSGNGRYALELSKIGYKTSALEITKSGSKIIQQSAAEQKLSINIITADFLEISSKNNSYDLIVCSGLLEEIPKSTHSKAILGFSNWLKIKGILIIKYCSEIFGRGELVNTEEIKNSLTRNKFQIDYIRESPNLKIGRSGNLLRTTTIKANLLTKERKNDR